MFYKDARKPHKKWQKKLENADKKTGKCRYKRHRRRQRHGFLNRYNFAYAGRDAINTAMTQLNAMVPKLINQTTNQVDQIAQKWIQQIINQDRQQAKKIAPKIIKGDIEEVYKTPFRLLGKFSKNSCIV